MAGAVLIVPPVVETGDVSVVEKEGLLESSLSLCSWVEKLNSNAQAKETRLARSIIACRLKSYCSRKLRATFRALSRACSSSRAACFSRSSTLVKDIPVLASDDTAFDKVLALQGTRKLTLNWLIGYLIKFSLFGSQTVLLFIFVLPIALWENIASEIQEKQKRNSEIVTGRSTYLLAAVESLTFLPSKEAKCCSRASSRLLGACRDRKHRVSEFLRCRKCCVYGHRDQKGQWWATRTDQEEHYMPYIRVHQ